MMTDRVWTVEDIIAIIEKRDGRWDVTFRQVPYDHAAMAALGAFLRGAGYSATARHGRRGKSRVRCLDSAGEPESAPVLRAASRMAGMCRYDCAGRASPMQTAWSACRTCGASASAVEYTATVR